jgi:F0F1-type ATP synthase membrane subunit a
MVVLPLVPATEHWWESNISKLAVSAAMGLAALLWMHLRAGEENALGSAAHAIAEFVPFIVLLLVLYVISGSVRLEGHIPGSTGANTCMLALGADTVLLGRAFVYALAAQGEAGVANLLDLIAREMRVAMTLTGAHRIADIGRDSLVRLP